jgi:hypothetical protein
MSGDTLNKCEMTAETWDLFKDIVGDMGNWSGTPPCYNHITAARRGNLADLKKRGLVSTFESDGEEWISVEAPGLSLARELGLIS